MAMLGGFLKGKKKTKQHHVTQLKDIIFAEYVKNPNCKGGRLFIWIVLLNLLSRAGACISYTHWIGLSSASNQSEINYTLNRIRVVQPGPKQLNQSCETLTSDQWHWHKTRHLIGFLRLTKLTCKSWAFLFLSFERMSKLNFLIFVRTFLYSLTFILENVIHRYFSVKMGSIVIQYGHKNSPI